MSLNCLTCHFLRAGSDRKYGSEISRKNFGQKVERNWSGNLIPPKNDRLGKIKKQHHRRVHSEGVGALPNKQEPRLTRSSGRRREWIFEDFPVKKEKRVRFLLSDDSTCQH